jgi:multidrug resistance efflux pump
MFRRAPRAEKLVAQNFISRERLDESRSAYERDLGRVEPLQADRATRCTTGSNPRRRGVGRSVAGCALRRYCAASRCSPSR